MLRKLLLTGALALSVLGSMTMATQAQWYDQPREGTSSQPHNAPSGGGQDRPYDPE